jgi:hypothetical protein
MQLLDLPEEILRVILKFVFDREDIRKLGRIAALGQSYV